MLDNTVLLAKVTQKRSYQARLKAEHMLGVDPARVYGTVAGFARAAGVSRSWLYTQPDILQRIRTGSRKPASNASASEASLIRRLDVALTRLRELREENAVLRARVEVAYGEIRVLRRQGPTGVTMSPAPDETSARE